MLLIYYNYWPVSWIDISKLELITDLQTTMIPKLGLVRPKLIVCRVTLPIQIQKGQFTKMPKHPITIHLYYITHIPTHPLCNWTCKVVTKNHLQHLDM